MRTDLKKGSGNGGDVTQSEERNIGVGCSPEDAGKLVVWGWKRKGGAIDLLYGCVLVIVNSGQVVFNDDDRLNATKSIPLLLLSGWYILRSSSYPKRAPLIVHLTSL